MSYTGRRRFLWILFLMGIALAAVVASATTLAPLSFDDLAHQSVAVAQLRCLGSESLWECGEIWTDTRFEVVEQHKGPLDDIVTVRTLGGRVGDLHAHVDGVPEFRVAEEVYLFLWAKPGEPYRVMGWSQGTFRIARNARGGEEKVTLDSAVAAFDSHGRQVHIGGIRGMTVTAFQNKCARLLSMDQPKASIGGYGSLRESEECSF
jgi:hypothetical protein